MKLHLAAIAFNEKELDTYVSQLISGGFEPVSDVKKADDGTYFQALAKTVRTESLPALAKPVAATEPLSPQA